MATATQTIKEFELYMDDMTELSSTEELALYNKIYQKVCSEKAWEFLKKEASLTTSTTVPYVSLPSDFSYLTQNYNYTDTVTDEAERPVVFLGANFEPFKVVSWSDRRQYRNQGGYAYIDIANSRLVFTKQPATAKAVEFDYISVPTDLALNETPVFPERFNPIIYHGMCIDDNIIQMSDKAKSYKTDHQVKYSQYLSDMARWNARLIQM